MRTNEGAGRSSLQTKVILILTVPVFLGITYAMPIAKGNFKYNRHCQNYNKRPLAFRDKARKIRASESRGQIYLYYAERRRICAKRNV